MQLPHWLPRWLHPRIPAPSLFEAPEAARLFDGLPLQTRRAFSRLSASPGSDPASQESAQLELLHHLRELPPSLFSIADWLLGFRQMVSRGAFRLGGAFREKAVNRALGDAESLPPAKDTLITGFSAAIDQAQFDLARHFLDRLAAVKKVGQSTRNRLASYLALHQGQMADFFALTPPPSAAPESHFLNYIQDRTVAIVGPAAPASPQGPEIDRFDVIARSNHRGTETPYDPATSGSRSDISFYAHAILHKLESDGQAHRFTAWLDSLDWAVTKSLDYDFLKALLHTGKIARRQWNQLYLHGHPNLTPSNLYSLLCCRARRVKVFNSNLYLSSTPYAEGYVKRLNLSIMFRSMAGHDCVSQLNFMRNLHRAGVMELDPECASVVRLTGSEYLAGLERIFANPSVSPSE